MDLAARKAAAKARLEKAEASITESDRAEIAERDEIVAIEGQAEEVERTRRGLDLERRITVAQEALGPDAQIEGVAIQTFPDTFIVRRNGRAYATWSAAIKSEAHGKKIDRASLDLTLVKDSIYDWNGTTDFDTNSESTATLVKYLKANAGLVTPLIDVVAKLAGVFAEARKSGA